MRTVVVGIKGMEMVDNFTALPIRFISSHHPDVEIIINDAPRYQYAGDVICNFDLLIDLPFGAGDIELHTVSPYTVVIRRDNKDVQYSTLLTFAKSGRYSGLVLPKRYGDGMCQWLHGMASEDVKQFLLKVPNGARGIGQAVVTLSEMGTPHGFMTDLKRFIVQADKMDRVTESRDGDGLSNFVSKHGTLSLATGLSNYDTESLDRFVKEFSSITAYEYLTDIAEEYRILTDFHSDIFYVGKRVINVNKDGYAQAGYIDTEVEPNEISPEVQQLLKDMSLRQMSIDLFVRKDGTWGIFEWQPQTGVSSLSPKTVYDWHRNFVDDVVNDYLNLVK